jgi:hypothetical protein
MRAALLLDGCKPEEQVHEHGLAAADAAMDIETLDRDLWLACPGKHPAERTLLGRRLARLQLRQYPIELFGNAELVAVGLVVLVIGFILIIIKLKK